MKPESAGYLAKARECLDAAKTINAIPLPPVAAKEAYLAAYHAAHAFVFENTGRAAKSHGGMRSMLPRSRKADPHGGRARAGEGARPAHGPTAETHAAAAEGRTAAAGGRCNAQGTDEKLQRRPGDDLEAGVRGSTAFQGWMRQ